MSKYPHEYPVKVRINNPDTPLNKRVLINALLHSWNNGLALVQLEGETRLVTYGAHCIEFLDKYEPEASA